MNRRRKTPKQGNKYKLYLLISIFTIVSFYIITNDFGLMRLIELKREQTGLEREILIDVKRTINSGLDGNLKTPIEILKEMWERLKKSAEKSKAFAERAKAKAKKVKAKANRAKAKAKKVKIDAKILRKKCQEIYQQEKTQQTKQEKADAVKAEAAAVKAEDAARIAEYERVTAEKEAATAAAIAIGDLEAVENISKIPEEKSEPLEEDEDDNQTTSSLYEKLKQKSQVSDTVETNTVIEKAVDSQDRLRSLLRKLE